MNAKSALGKGLGSLIPGAGSEKKVTLTERIIPEARQEVLDVAIEKISPNPRQPRHHFAPADLEDLMGSIKEHGILMPLVVTRSKGGYEIVAGERRFRASKALGLKTVPAIVREATEQQKLELAIIENVQRQDLNPVEEAIAYKALIEEFNLTQEEVARRMGKSRSVVANTVRLLDLSEEMLDALRQAKISKSHARTLLSEPNGIKRDQMFHVMLSGKMTVREAEKTAGSKKPSAKKVKDPNVLAHEERLREFLGTRVEIQERGGKGKVMIHFYSREELYDLLDKLSN